MRASDRMIGIGAIALSATGFGSMPVFADWTYESGGDPIALLVVRFSVAAAVMTVWMTATRRAWPRGRVLFALCALGGIGYVGQSFSYFTALTMASASLVALLLYLYPALVTIIGATVNRERIDGVTGRALVLALTGTVLVVGLSAEGRPMGIALGVAAALIYSVYILIGSRVTPAVGAIPSTTVVLLAGTAVFTAIAFVLRPDMPGTTRGWTGAVMVGLLSVIAILAFFEGLARLGPSDASTISTLEPVVTVILAWSFLGETITPLQIAGGVLILVAAVVLARHDADAARATDSIEDSPAAHV